MDYKKILEELEQFLVKQRDRNEINYWDLAKKAGTTLLNQDEIGVFDNIYTRIKAYECVLQKINQLKMLYGAKK